MERQQSGFLNQTGTADPECRRAITMSIKKYFKDSNSRIPKTLKTQPNLDKSRTPQRKTNREKNKQKSRFVLC